MRDESIRFARDGYRVSLPAPLASTSGVVVMGVLVRSESAFRLEEQASISSEIRRACRRAMPRRHIQNVAWMPLAEGWLVTYSFKLAAPEMVRTELYQKLVRELDRVFGLPGAFDPAVRDMSFMDEEPTDPEDRDWMDSRPSA